MTDRERAGESLDLLKAIASRSPSAQHYVGSCISQIDGALRLEAQRGVPEATVRRSWKQAATHCVRLVSALCNTEIAKGSQVACRNVAANQD